ncbi:cupin domain-containing protein [Polaribacter porphyrae]|uniref:(S)-ureidoglycine aminohydrolase cupin domain-containing protein n=1 Tax=Polaribacter porphyrae TaxID=1137780 RepID=A0A2S7WKL5_9FLAO|nr:cupin domain-containing protein [Polaribacter porphyrae]PQJ77976.1 hypothetical protein BTO18_01690 [Polaribacter porphyrae]
MKTKNNFTLTIIFAMILQLVSYSQNSKKDNEIKPFKIDSKYLSGLEIPQIKLKAHPNRKYFQKTIYSGKELSVFVLSSETALNKIKSFPIDEFVYYINGKAEVKNDKQNTNFYAGDYLAVLKGFSGNWTNIGGNTYHLELSVISNRKSKKIATSKDIFPFLLNKDLLSGINLKKQDSVSFSNILYSGTELEIKTVSEKPNSRKISNNKKEEFIHILSGGVSITPLNGKLQTFYKGDFFILPKGFNGLWESKGNNLLRTIIVSESDIL